jgi:hypothetical protein
VNSLPTFLRMLVLVLTALAVGSALRRPAEAGPELLRVRAGEPVADEVLSGSRPAAVVREGTAAPSRAELGRLAALAGLAPLYVQLPAETPVIFATRPARPRVGWASAVPFRVRGEPGDSVAVHLHDPTGPLDSLRVEVGADGWAVGAFRIRPATPGWSEWVASTDGAAARVGARVAVANPPRVLLLAGAPGWESRFATRALEEGGASVETVKPLGRGLVAGNGEGLPDGRALDAFDAVLLLDGAAPSAAEAARLRAYQERGGGVLSTVPLPGEAPPAAPVAGLQVDARTLRWSVPAELSALPAEPLRLAARPLGPAAPGSLDVLHAPAGVLLRLSARGRGRGAELGLLETWPWRMEAGRIDQHRAFWSALAEWLGSGARARAALRLPELGSAGERVVGVDVGAGAPRLLHPDGRMEALAGASFVPEHPGVYSLLRGPDTATIRIEDDVEIPSDAWARLAQLAHASGGGALPAGLLEARLAERFPGPRVPADPRRLLPALLAGIVAAAGAEWALRRTRGLP